MAPAARWLAPAAVGVLLTLLVGCSPSKSADETASPRLPWEGVPLRLAVVDDPDFAAAISRAGGEWKVQTGSVLTVESITEAALVRADRIEMDAVVCPSRLLGPLAERALLAPIPEARLQSAGAAWMDVFELARSHEAAWAGRVMAVPLGSPVLVCYYRADLLARLGMRPPTTWSQYHQLAAILADPDKLGPAAPSADAAWSGTLEPLGSGWAGLTLLARAAAGVKHRDNFSDLFNIQTMEPLVDRPAMIRALMDLVADAKYGSLDAKKLSPEDVRRRFWQGQAALALAWPSATAKLSDKLGKGRDVGIVALPGSKDVFNLDEGSWESRSANESVHVPLLAVAGRLGVVSRESKHADAAAEMLLWLAGTALSPPPSAHSPATTLFRRTQMSRPQLWTEAPMSPATASAYAAATEATFDCDQWLFALRIPGRAEYLSALDDAVHQALDGKVTPAAALREAAGRWREITRRLGVEKQRIAYLHSLGLEP